MVNYNNGKIYKIECLSGDPNDIYIGSTTKEYLSQRMDTHRNNYKCWKGGKTGKMMSFNLFDKYGVENCVITLIESVNAITKNELQSREAFYIRTMNCVNKYIPLRTRQEYKKRYSEINHEKISEQNKIYYEKNKDIIAEKANKRYLCECGTEISKRHKSEHNKTKRHQELMKQNEKI